MKQIYDNKDIGETIDKSFDAGIKEGYRRCMEQMMKEAVDYEIVSNLAAYPIIYYEVKHLGLKDGDKVKIIIIKEDEK